MPLEGQILLGVWAAERVEARDANDALFGVEVLDLGLDSARVDLVGTLRVAAELVGVVGDGREGSRKRLARVALQRIKPVADDCEGTGDQVATCVSRKAKLAGSRQPRLRIAFAA